MAETRSLVQWQRLLLLTVCALQLISPTLGDDSDDPETFADYFHMLSHPKQQQQQLPVYLLYNNNNNNNNGGGDNSADDDELVQIRPKFALRPVKRVPGSEFLGKRVPGSEFLGKRVPGSEFLGKRVPGSEFLGKRAPGSEFLGKRAPGSEFLGKRVPGSEFLGKRSYMLDEDLVEMTKRSPEFSNGISQSDRDNYIRGLTGSQQRR